MKTTFWTAAFLLAGATFASGLARAESSPDYQEPASSTQYTAPVEAEAGAGIGNFTGGLGDRTNIGPDWTVRGTFNLNKNVGIEAGYLGANNQIDDVRLAQSHSITTTGMNADLKIGAPLNAMNKLVVRPYVLGGVGAAYYGVSGTDNNLYKSDSDMQFPLGAGADARFNELLSVGARFNYQLNIANRIGNEVGGNQYGITATLGARY